MYGTPASRADIVDSKDVGMVQRGSGAGLLLEAAQPVRIRRERRRQDLQRDIAPETRCRGRGYTSPIPPAPSGPMIS